MLKIINNTKISITSLKTGKETIILDTDYDSETHKTGNVVAGIPLTECVDNSLDSFVITYKGGSKELFTPYELVVFEINDGLEKKEYRMCIQSDRIQSYQPKYMNYTHTVFLIELTKLLEKIIVFSLNLTNPKDTLSDQFEKACINAEPVVTVGGEAVNSRRLFLSDSLKSLLSGAESEDFWFSNTDMRTVFDTMLSRFNCRCTVENVTLGEDGNITEIYIGYRSLSKVKTVAPIWTEEENGVIVNEEQTIDGQNFAGRLRGRGYNTYSTTPVTVNDMFKSANASITSDNAVISLPFPIGENGFDSFMMNLKVRGEDSQPSDPSISLTVDLKERFIPSEKYSLLDSDMQKIYIPFEIGAKSIVVGGQITLFGISIFSKDHFENVIIDYINTNLLLGEYYRAKSIEGKFYDVPFTAVYKPIINTIVDMEKPGVYDKDYLNMSILGSQTENNLDEMRHGKQALSDIRRTGNAEWYIDVSAKYFSKLLPLMSKITDNYVVYKREIGVYDRFVKCRYYLSKDYNTVEQNAGIRRERHLYNIPLESDECPIVVKQYLMFSTKKPTKYKEDIFSSECMKSTFNRDDIIGDNKGYIKQLLFVSREHDPYINSPNVEYPKYTEVAEKGQPYKYSTNYFFVRPTANYVQGKTLHFVATVQDNYSVDYSRAGYIFSVFGDKGNMITYNRYVSNSERYAGECYEFKLLYAMGEKEEVDRDGYPVSLFNNFYPYGTYDNAEKSIYTILYEKDRTQTPYFELQIECTPTEDDYGKIFIGTKFCENNRLLREPTNEKLYLYYSGKERLSDSIDCIDTSKWELKKIYDSDSELYNRDDYYSLFYYSSNGRVIYLKIGFSSNELDENRGTWCVTDKNGNILFGKNFIDDGIKDIYVYFSNKKE